MPRLGDAPQRLRREGKGQTGDVPDVQRGVSTRRGEGLKPGTGGWDDPGALRFSGWSVLLYDGASQP